MDVLNADNAIESYLLDVMNRQEALRLLELICDWGDSLPLTELRTLPLEVQIKIFEVWGVTYHVDRHGHCNITDYESLRLSMSSKSSVELSVALIGKTAIVVSVIGNSVLAEDSRKPGAVFVLGKEILSGSNGSSY